VTDLPSGIAAYRRAIDNRVLDATDRLVRSYARIQAQLVLQLDGLVAEIEAARAAGRDMTATQVRKLARFERLIGELTTQMERYGAVVENEVTLGRVDAVALASRDLPKLIEAQLTMWPEGARQSLLATFQRMPSEAIEAMVGALQDDLPLQRLTLARFGPDRAAAMGDKLLLGLASGRGPRAVARDMANVLGVPLSDALRISRTEIVRAHRLATHAGFVRNGHIVKGWIWRANLDTRTCMSCVAMDGTVHGNDETLDDHPNGRCYPEPVTVEPRDLGINVDLPRVERESGKAWFSKLPEAAQRDMMGDAKWEAWRAGKFGLVDLARERKDADWGRMFSEASLKELVSVD
jgi:hypothetical protein